MESPEMKRADEARQSGAQERSQRHRRFEQEQELERERWEWEEEERLEKKKNPNKCVLTSACIKAKGLPDDCVELTVLRSFRDNYIKSLPNGPQIINDYYKIAPGIIKKIEENTNPEDMYNHIFGIITECVELIQNNECEKALSKYNDMVNSYQAA